MKTILGIVKAVTKDKKKAIIYFNDEPLIMLDKNECANLQRELTKVWKEMV